MSEILRLFGSVLIVLGAIILGRGYGEYCERRLKESEGFLAFLVHARGEVVRSLTPPEGFVRSFRSEALEGSGFLSALRGGESLGSAFESSMKKSSLGKELRELLSEFFSEFGRDYKDGETARIEDYIDRVRTVVESERENLEKNSKICRVLLVAGALGLIILMI